jgi:hypothetical protein
LGQNDDIAQLIIPLGSTVDFGLKRCLEGYSSTKRTVKDWVDFGLTELTGRILKWESEPSVHAISPVSQPKTGWQAYLKEQEDCIDLMLPFTNVAARLESNRHYVEGLEDEKAYLLEIQDALSKHNAKTWYELYPTEEPKAKTKTRMRPSNANYEREWAYVYWLKGRYCYHDERVPQHFTAAYDELYEACYHGDNEKVQKLCLQDWKPEADGVKDESPLNISVRYVTKPTRAGDHYPDWGNSSILLPMPYAERCLL